MHDEINLAADHQFLQFLCPQVLGGEFPQGDGGVQITGRFLGEDFIFILGECALQRGQNQIGLEQSQFRFAGANGEGLLGGGGGSHFEWRSG